MAKVNLQQDKYLRGTTFKVTFPTLTTLHKTQPRRIDLIQKRGAHDVVKFEYPQVSELWFNTVKSGIPVNFSWTHGGITKHWIGYVQGISKTSSPQRSNIMEVTCWGSTFPLKERSTRVFKNSTITDAVRKIVTEHGFNFIGDAHPYRFSNLSISGQSYWEWIQEQAEHIGYGAYADGMDFYFRKLDKLIDQGFSQAPVLSMSHAQVPTGASVVERTLQKFKVLHSEHVETDKNLRAVKSVGGVDPMTSKPFLSVSSPDSVGKQLRSQNSSVLFTQHLARKVAPDKMGAGALADGAAELGRFNMPATALCQGDYRIRPYGTVLIAGTGDLTDGYWLVNESRHMLHAVGDYEIELKLASDGTGNTAKTPFRKRDSSTVGLVDLNHALTTGGRVANHFPPSSVRLFSPEKITKQGNQGYKRTPTAWKSAKSR